MFKRRWLRDPVRSRIIDDLTAEGSGRIGARQSPIEDDLLMRVLLINDEATIREVLSTALTVIAGHDVRACASAREALTQAPTFAPDLLLIDLMMPEMDGIAALAALRELPGLAAVPAVFISATADPQLLARAQSLQPRAVLQKPLDVVTIGAALERLCHPR